jgi:hypothetical protein
VWPLRAISAGMFPPSDANVEAMPGNRETRAVSRPARTPAGQSDSATRATGSPSLLVGTVVIRLRRIGQAGLATAIPIFAVLAAQTASATVNPTAAAASSPNATGSSKPAAATAPGAKSVSYNGVRVTVPASWPVIDLNVHPRTCVRLDQTALYLGSPGSQPNCPAHAVGRADTVWLSTQAAGQEVPLTSGVTKVGGLAARVGLDSTGHSKAIQFVGKPVGLQASWGADSSSVEKVLASAVSTGSSSAAPAPSAAAQKPLSPAAAPQAVVAGATFIGMGFDTCAAPSVSTMRAWLHSPYRSVGVYIGGSMRACGDGNLSASWVAQVHAMGWHLIPTYVGPQAPTVNQPGLARISPVWAWNLGGVSAIDAVARAKHFGMGAGTPLYYDMEGYTPTAGSSAAVNTFLSAWTAEVHRLGYKSGVYGCPGSVMSDMSHAVRTATIYPPDDVWFAHWNGLRNTTDQRNYPAFPDAYWRFHQRLHQYAGNLYQSYGGVALGLDANWMDGATG